MANKNIVQSRYAPLRHCSSVVALLAASLLLVGVSSCTKEAGGEEQGETLVKILPQAQLATGGIEIESTNTSNPQAQTKAPVDGTTTALEFYFARADETSSGVYGNWNTTAFSGNRAAGAGATDITFATTQYYLPGGVTPLNTKITGWYPGGAVSGGAGYYNGNSVEWSLDGSQDIMVSTSQVGSRTNAMQAFEFKHKLSQLLFCPYAESQAVADLWGNITKIEVGSQNTSCSYTMANASTGVLTFSSSGTFSAGVATSGVAMSICPEAQKETDAKQMGNPVMIEPQTVTNYKLSLKITTENQGEVDVEIVGSFPESTSRKIFLKFTAEGIFANAPGIVDWVPGYTHTGGDIEI